MEQKDNFNHQFILFDTNLLINLVKHRSGMQIFLDFLSINQCINLITDAINFEFLGYAKNPSEYKTLDDWLKSFEIIPSGIEDVKHAIWLSVLMRNKLPQIGRQISYIDFLIAAQLMKYKNKIILATINWRDFPEIMFDRIKIMAVDTGKDVLTIAFIQFNLEKYKKISEDFNKGLEAIENKNSKN